MEGKKATKVKQAIKLEENKSKCTDERRKTKKISRQDKTKQNIPK